MAAFEQKELSGALFKNDKKEKESHPDYRGSCKIAGQEWEIGAWLKTSPKGTKYMSLSFSEPFKKPVKVAGDDDTAPRKSKPAPNGDFDDFDSPPF